MNIEIENNEKATVVRLGGRLDAGGVAEIKPQLVAEAEKSGTNIVLNMAEVNFIDSTGLGLVVSAFRKLRENDGDMQICSLSAQAQTLFELTRMHRIFNIHEDEATALSSLD